MSDLKRVTQLAALLVEQNAKVKELKYQLKEAEEAARRTEQEDLPELMLECGLQSFVLEDGSKVSIREEVSTAITAANAKAAMGWLTDNDFGGIIKTVVSVKFDRGEYTTARELSDQLQSRYGAAELKESVHPATLKAFVKEQMAAGTAIPLELFSVHPYNIAKITKGK